MSRPSASTSTWSERRIHRPPAEPAVSARLAECVQKTSIATGMYSLGLDKVLEDDRTLPENLMDQLQRSIPISVLPHPDQGDYYNQVLSRALYFVRKNCKPVLLPKKWYTPRAILPKCQLTASMIPAQYFPLDGPVLQRYLRGVTRFVKEKVGIQQALAAERLAHEAQSTTITRNTAQDLSKRLQSNAPEIKSEEDSALNVKSENNPASLAGSMLPGERLETAIEIKSEPEDEVPHLETPTTTGKGRVRNNSGLSTTDTTSPGRKRKRTDGTGRTEDVVGGSPSPKHHGDGATKRQRLTHKASNGGAKSRMSTPTTSRVPETPIPATPQKQATPRSLPSAPTQILMPNIPPTSTDSSDESNSDSDGPEAPKDDSSSDLELSNVDSSSESGSSDDSSSDEEIRPTIKPTRRSTDKLYVVQLRNTVKELRKNHKKEMRESKERWRQKTESTRKKMDFARNLLVKGAGIPASEIDAAQLGMEVGTKNSWPRVWKQVWRYRT
ncbi:hypothetical protein H2200_013554 [Cladophialophora chaetospira]|uniref:Uncharacterized protein n=1 Tax=Cladophialophora chaetospira TaxID=386627 RepID=A0AA38U8W1_9EURO|nr:hypothetical protein H2200_013554 [Cladophialophora chaetospira]